VSIASPAIVQSIHFRNVVEIKDQNLQFYSLVSDLQKRKCELVSTLILVASENKRLLIKVAIKLTVIR